MGYFRIYLLDQSAHIVGVREVSADDRAQAAEAAHGILASARSELRVPIAGVEIWEGAEMVSGADGAALNPKALSEHA